jgi:hypothetical protein
MRSKNALRSSPVHSDHSDHNSATRSRSGNRPGLRSSMRMLGTSCPQTCPRLTGDGSGQRRFSRPTTTEAECFRNAPLFVECRRPAPNGVAFVNAPKQVRIPGVGFVVADRVVGIIAHATTPQCQRECQPLGSAEASGSFPTMPTPAPHTARVECRPFRFRRSISRTPGRNPQRRASTTATKLRSPRRACCRRATPGSPDTAASGEPSALASCRNPISDSRCFRARDRTAVKLTVRFMGERPGRPVGRPGRPWSQERIPFCVTAAPSATRRAEGTPSACTRGSRPSDVG